MKENLMENDRATEPYTYITISSLVKMGKQIERLQEQLKEANEVIKNMKLCMDDKYDYDSVAEDVDTYLERYGVK